MPVLPTQVTRDRAIAAIRNRIDVGLDPVAAMEAAYDAGQQAAAAELAAARLRIASILAAYDRHRVHYANLTRALEAARNAGSGS